MRLVLVRHGRSMANQAQLVTGNTRDELSPEGLLQIRHTATFLKNLNLRFDHGYTSQWRRAQQSAELIAPDMTISVDPRLGETDAGRAAEMPLQQFLETWPNFYRSPFNNYPDGESHEELNRRVLVWLHELRARCSGNVLAVTHAGPIACLLQHALDIPVERFPALLAQNASISVIEYRGIDDNGRVVVFSWLPETTASQVFCR